jgi:hypothetical protein
MVRSVSRLSESFRLEPFLFALLIWLIFFLLDLGGPLDCWLYPRDRKRAAEDDKHATSTLIVTKSAAGSPICDNLLRGCGPFQRIGMESRTRNGCFAANSWASVQ